MFGALIIDVENGTPGEKLAWAYHVAPIIRLRDQQLYVMDPLISDRPVTKATAHAELGNPDMDYEDPSGTGITISGQITGYVTCKPETYDRYYDCFDPRNNPNDEDLKIEETKEMLDMYGYFNILKSFLKLHEYYFNF